MFDVHCVKQATVKVCSPRDACVQVICSLGFSRDSGVDECFGGAWWHAGQYGLGRLSRGKRSSGEFSGVGSSPRKKLPLSRK